MRPSSPLTLRAFRCGAFFYFVIPGRDPGNVIPDRDPENVIPDRDPENVIPDRDPENVIPDRDPEPRKIKKTKRILFDLYVLGPAPD